MTGIKSQLTTKQLIFQELFVGMLIFVATLGTLSEYTDIVLLEICFYLGARFALS
jgi:hypothetical protein